MLRLGCFATAAERYAALGEWDRVAECYAASGKRERPRGTRPLGRANLEIRQNFAEMFGSTPGSDAAHKRNCSSKEAP